MKATVCAICMPCIGWACDAGGTPMAPLSLGAPEVSVSFGRPPVARPFSMELTFCEGAPDRFEIDVSMPAHQHGMNYSPKISELGEGRFLVEGMFFHMPGVWQIRVDAETARGPVGYVLDIRAQ
ncbi:hypothetical protein [Silicimonas sp. MF1-12-2]|uniref:hypothetical protein n=1 Tax=Silicimonas sp. MF1-12-2 TaxID=3384793 RepID=UPI0039B44C41